MTELMSMKDLQIALSCSPSFVKKLCKDDRLKTIKIGRRRYARRQDFENFINELADKA